MWFEHNDMDDLERLLIEQKEKDDKVRGKQKDLNNNVLQFLIFFNPCLLRFFFFKGIMCTTKYPQSSVDQYP